jgi:hypothetical protein
MRVHKQHVQNGELQPGVFKDVDGGMSVNWQKYSTPTQARLRAKNPAVNGIIALRNAGDVRRIVAEQSPLRVEHTPEPDDRSHTEVFGNKKAAGVRIALLDLHEWEIRVNDPVE